jgi:hypothetical protein
MMSQASEAVDLDPWAAIHPPWTAAKLNPRRHEHGRPNGIATDQSFRPEFYD